MDTTHKAKEVGEIVPPKVGPCDDASNNPEGDGDNGERDKDGVERDKATVARRRDAAHKRSDVLGGYATIISVVLS